MKRKRTVTGDVVVRVDQEVMRLIFARIAASVAHGVMGRRPSDELWNLAYDTMMECAAIPNCLPPGAQWFFS